MMSKPILFLNLSYLIDHRLWDVVWMMSFLSVFVFSCLLYLFVIGSK